MEARNQTKWPSSWRWVMPGTITAASTVNGSQDDLLGDETLLDAGEPYGGFENRTWAVPIVFSRCQIQNDHGVEGALNEAREAILDVKQVAHLLKTTERTVEETARRGGLGRKIGREWRFHLDEIVGWLGGRKRSVTPEKTPKPVQQPPKSRSAIEPWDWSDRNRNLSKGLDSGDDVGYSNAQGKVLDRSSSRKGGTL